MTDRFRSLPDLSTLVIIAIGALTLWTFSGSIDAKEISARESSAKGSSAKKIAAEEIAAEEVPAERQVRLRLTEQESGTRVLLQAISPVDDQVVWVSGHGGTFLRTTDGGLNWLARVMPGADTLQFRDVDAFDARTAYLMSSGPGSLSRIYRTDDGGGYVEPPVLERAPRRISRLHGVLGFEAGCRLRRCDRGEVVRVAYRRRRRVLGPRA